jgi:Protein of unknown function (DUF4446)
VTGIVLSVRAIAFASAVGAFCGVVGVILGLLAQRCARRAVRECRDMIEGAVGSRGTVDPRALRDMAVVRYDALNEMSGQLSFSVALLNAAGDGIVLTSINSRASSRTYAKPVVAGQGTQELSPEEAHAVRTARLGAGMIPDSPAPSERGDNGTRRTPATA